MNLIYQLDESVLWFVREHLVHAYLTPVLKLITTLGNAGIIWILLTILMLIYKPTRKVGIISAIALAEEFILCNGILKNLIRRPRPWTRVHGLNPLVAKPTDFSFPSGHSSSSFAVGVTMFRKADKKIGIPALILAICIACSRIYVAVHYPTDVLAGIVIGIVFSYVGEFTYHKIEQYIENRKEKSGK